jgi:simple sugar transport system ATP-binding protein
MTTLISGAASAGPDAGTVTPLLQVVDIVKHYAGVQALSGVSLQVAPGEILALAGENGSGKSTLIRAIAGVERPDSGRIMIDGVDWSREPPAARIGAGVQIIYQDFAPFPNLTAAENIWLPRQLSEGRPIISRRRGRSMAKRALDKMEVKIDLDRPLGELPVAHKQLAAIARALTFDARLLIMDEPTTALTHRDVEHLFAIIRPLAARGMGFIFVSHKLQEVAALCKRAVVLRNGLKTLDAPLADLSESDIQIAMTGREISTSRYSRAPAPTGKAPRLQVDGLDRDDAFHNVGFIVAPGEIVGLAGLMGAGRTALAKSIFGLLPADSGRIRMDGRPLTIRSVGQAIAAGIAYVPEDRLSEGLFLDFSIRDNVIVRCLDHLVTGTGWLTPGRRSAEARKWIARLKIKAPSDRAPANSLSGGNQQRVVLAKWIASAPRLLILNRPSVGVDVGSKAEIHDIVVELAESGVGIIIISDDMPELMRVSDRILVMRNGRIVAERRTEDSSEQDILDVVNEADG